MRFTHLLAAGTSLLVTVAAISAEQVANWLHDLSVEQDKLVAPANEITVINTPLAMINQGPFPIITNGMLEIRIRLKPLIDQLQSNEPFQGEAEAIVVDAYLKFSKSQMDFVAILNAKATLVGKLPVVGFPVGPLLQTLKKLDDDLTLALLQLVENRGVIETQGSNMGNLLAETAAEYQLFV